MKPQRAGTPPATMSTGESLEPLAKIPNSHPERSGPKDHAVEGSPPEKERTPRMSKALLDVGTLRLTRRTRSLRVIKEAIFDLGSEFRTMQAPRVVEELRYGGRHPTSRVSN